MNSLKWKTKEHRVLFKERRFLKQAASLNLRPVERIEVHCHVKGVLLILERAIALMIVMVAETWDLALWLVTIDLTIFGRGSIAAFPQISRLHALNS